MRFNELLGYALENRTRLTSITNNHNDGEVLIFPRTKLGSYLVNLQTYFADMSDYVAMGSKRRTEANDAYRELNNTKNVALYAKYLETEGYEDVTLFCKWLKYLINQNEF